MHLTINEISFLIKIWNSWYLLQHDSHLNSRYSDNGVTIKIKPIEVKSIPKEVIDDLKDYTDHIDIDNPNEIKIEFLFSAFEHQTEEIFSAIKPVISMAEKSHIIIDNYMDFIETELPSEDEVIDSMGKDVATEFRKYKEENLEEDKGQKIIKPHNNLYIEGIINKDYFEVNKVLHNNEEISNLEDFLEASRLYETIERNFKDSDEEEQKIKSFNCNSNVEAELVKTYLYTCCSTQAEIKDNLNIETDAFAEDMATIISFVRYQNKFSLFKNPYEKNLRLKRRQQSKAMRDLMTKSCTCFMVGIMIIMFLVTIFIIYKTKKP